MYLSQLRIENFRCFGEADAALSLELRPGLTAIVGPNDIGKSAVIDAIRFSLGTTDQEWIRIEDTDFHNCDTTRQIRVSCTFNNLSARDKRLFLEYLSYEFVPGVPVSLHLHWTLKDTGALVRGRPYRRPVVRSGKDGDGPEFVAEAREMIKATYLRPLRDAEEALSAGRGSRLAQVLHAAKATEAGGEHDLDQPLTVPNHQLSVLGIAKLIDELLREQAGVKETVADVDVQLNRFALVNDVLKSAVQISGADAPSKTRIRQLLEKLDLGLGGHGQSGLGSNNVLFMACELLLLANQDGNPLLLVEEPEAHLHAQRQLKAMAYLQSQATDQDVQVIVTTHSPNLASAIELENIILLEGGSGFSLSKKFTRLESSDYRFLSRFLDVTKANLFFARGVVIVEGDGENILLPVLAKLLGRSFTDYGVSVVNVGSTGLRRYARIFQRASENAADRISLPVACIADLDVMPNCAEGVINKQLKTKSQFVDGELDEHRAKILGQADGQSVKSFVADEWTLEYDLALSELAEEVYVAAKLAIADQNCDRRHGEFDSDARLAKIDEAKQSFANIIANATQQVDDGNASGCTVDEVIACAVYSEFTERSKASKAICAQYLAERLLEKEAEQDMSPSQWKTLLPNYLCEAIEYVTAPIEDAPDVPNQDAEVPVA